MSDRIDLKVGFRCNNYCHFCVQGDKRERLPAKEEGELLKSLEEGRAGGAVPRLVASSANSFSERALRATARRGTRAGGT